MNKLNKFNVVVGIAIIVICIIISIMAYMSAVVINENADNIIYLDNGSGYVLSIPKSNLVSEYVNIQKEIVGQNAILNIDVKLPKVNVKTETIEKLNAEIYSIYQEIYNYAISVKKNETIKITYNYDYVDQDHILVITIEESKTVNNKTKTDKRIYRYDALKDEIVKE